MMNHITKFCILASLGFSLSANATIISFWDFNVDFVFPDETVEIVHAASQGNGTFYQQRADTDGNGKGGVAYVNSAEGLNVVEGRSIAWDDIGKSGNNDAQFFVVIDTTGFQDIQIRFDVRGNIDPTVVSYDVDYATAGTEIVTQTDQQVLDGVEDFAGTFVDFLGGNSTNILNNESIVGNVDAFGEEFIDLSSVTALNNQANLVLRCVGNDELTIDNFLVTGTAIPEPSSLTLLGLGSLALISRRKRV